MNDTIDAFAKFLQLSLLPVVLISAAGLILLSLTNRLGRVVDRSRSLANELESSQQSNDASREQLRVLLRRSSTLRLSVAFNTVSIIFSSLMIFGLIFFFVAGVAYQGLILAFFVCSILSLTVSAMFFLHDTSMALKALQLDIEPHLR